VGLLEYRHRAQALRGKGHSKQCLTNALHWTPALLRTRINPRGRGLAGARERGRWAVEGKHTRRFVMTEPDQYLLEYRQAEQERLLNY
jgi:hypothetical protein